MTAPTTSKLTMISLDLHYAAVIDVIFKFYNK